MASKGKDKIKVKKHEMEYNKKRIDLKRFAYDVMKYTALKFRVPESCIAVWDGSANDYEKDDFCLVVCRKIILCQLAERYRYHTFFWQHYVRNKLATPELIGRLLQEVIQKETEKFSMPTQAQVGVSLAVLCELFLFLYSENINLCPKQLATRWFQSYLNVNKKKFEAAGGFKQMYHNGTIKKFDDVDGFIDKFIEDHCLPYKTTASNPVITELFMHSFRKRLPKSVQKHVEEMEETVKSVTEMLKRQHADMEIEEVVVVPLPAPDEISRTNVSQNIGFGRIPHDGLLQLAGPSVASPQDPSAASPEGKPRRQRRSSYKQRMKMEMEDSEVDLLLNPGLGVPLPHEMYDFPFSVDAAQSRKLPEESVQELSKHTTESSRRESGKPSFHASLYQRLGQPSSDSSEKKRPIVGRTVASPKSPSASSPEQPQHHGTLSYKQRTKMIKSGLRASVEGLGQPSLDTPEKRKSTVTRTVASPKSPSASSPEELQQRRTLSYKQRMEMKSSVRANVEQGLGQLSPDAYEMKQSSRKTPSVPKTLVPSQDPSATSPEEQTRRPRILTDKEILKILCISDDESPEEILGVDLPSNPGLGVPLPHEMYDFLLDDVAELSKDLAEQSVLELSKHYRSSHRERRNEKPSLLASVDQGLAQPSSDSSEAKTLIVPRTLVPSQDPSATSSEEQPRSPRIGDEETAKILSICEEEPLTTKRGETLEFFEILEDFDLNSNLGLGVPLPHEMYTFAFSVDAAQSQDLPKERVQEASEYARLSRRERSRKPSLRASVEQGLGQPSSDSSETKKSIVTRTVASPKGSSASSPEQPQHHGTLSYKQRREMIKSGLRASVKGLGQASSDSYEIKQSSKKTPSVPRSLVPLQEPSATSPEEPPRRPRNLTDEQIAKILRNLTDEEIARILSISEEESITSKRDETSEVYLPSNPGLGVPLPQEMYDFPLVDVAELSQDLPEERVQETSKHARRLTHRERDWKPSLSESVGQPSSDSSKTKTPIVTRTIASRESPSASSPEQPQHHVILSYKQRMKMIKSGLRASVKGHGQASSDSVIATDATQSYERLGVEPKILVKNKESSGLQNVKSRGERKEIQEE